MKGLADRSFRSRNTASEVDYIESMLVILLHWSLLFRRSVLYPTQG